MRVYLATTLRMPLQEDNASQTLLIGDVSDLRLQG
jgi:hypothetical protein